jgi:flagellar biosynthesis component FlhA
MLNEHHRNPYGQIKEKTFLPLFLSVIVIMLPICLFPSLPMFPFLAVALLFWVWLLVRVWRYQPSAEERFVLIRNFQVLCTLAFCALVCFFLVAASAILFRPASLLFLLGLISFGLGCLAFLGSALVVWQAYRLNKAEQSRSLEDSEHSPQEQK